VAPMMDWTDNHYRTLARLISKHAWLYTEMLAAETIVYQKGNLVSFYNDNSAYSSITCAKEDLELKRYTKVSFLDEWFVKNH
jgi:tRNA-dihydrouridine synthase